MIKMSNYAMKLFSWHQVLYILYYKKLFEYYITKLNFMQMLLNLPFQKGHNADFIYCAYSFHIRIPKIHKTSLTQWKEIISQDNHTNWDVLMRGNIKDTNCIWKLALFRVLRIFEIRFFESKGVFQGDTLHEYKREWNDFTHMYIEIQLMVENIYSNMLFMQKIFYVSALFLVAVNYKLKSTEWKKKRRLVYIFILARSSY